MATALTRRRQAAEGEWAEREAGKNWSHFPTKPRPLTRADVTKDELQEEAWLNKVGTFGVASAGHWWGRAGGAIVRFSHYMSGPRIDFMLWVLLYSDDG